MASDDDYQLLDAWRGGDRDAGNRLFDRHFDSVYRFLSNKVDGDPADLVQRTFLGCVESKDRFRKESSFRTFLFCIARHELYRYWRKRRHDVDPSVTSIQDLGPTPSSALDKRQTDRLLLEALRALPLDLQIAVELHYWEGMTGPALAEVLEIPEGTVRSRLRRARLLLEEKLSELASSKAELESTMMDLERWSSKVRDTSGRSR